MRTISKYVGAMLVATTMTLASMPADAATVRRLELNEVKAQSVSIFYGQVVDIEKRIGTNGKMVWTDYEVSVSEHLRGQDPGVRTTVSFAGGTVGDISVGIPGVPRLQIGDTLVFFIQEGDRHPTPTVGWGQGLYRIDRVTIAGQPRELLVSFDGEPLEISNDGRLTRGPNIRVENGLVYDTRTPRLVGGGGRMPDPTWTSASGAPLQPEVNTTTDALRSAPLPERNFATLDDLRAFVDGTLEAVTVRPSGVR